MVSSLRDSDMIPNIIVGVVGMPTISKRLIDDEQPRASEFFVWDNKLAGFGVRIHPTGRKVFVAQVRVGRTLRRVKIGPYGAFTPEQARKRAEEIIRAAADGRDPQREKRRAVRRNHSGTALRPISRGGSRWSCNYPVQATEAGIDRRDR